MTETTCVRCTRPMPDQAYACGRCAQGLGDALKIAAGHAEDAEAVIARQTRYGGGSRGGSGEGLTPNLKTSGRWAMIVTAIGGWTEITIAETRRRPHWKPAAGPICAPARPGDEPRQGNRCGHDSCHVIRRRMPPGDISRDAAWLARPRQIDWLRKHPAADEAFKDLHQACASLARLVDRPEDNRHLIGVCDCGKVLYAPWDWTVIQCKQTNCGAVWNAADGQDILLRHLDDKLLTAAEAAKMAAYLDTERTQDATRKLIAKWAEHGRLLAHGHVTREPTDAELRDNPNIGLVVVPTYRFGDIRDLLAQTPRRNRERTAA